MKRLVPIVIFVVICVQAQAQQLKSFTHSPEPFLQELAGLMDASKKKVGKKFVEDVFTPAFISGRFNAQEQERIYAIGDKMLKSKMKAYPHFENYLNALISFSASTKTSGEFSEWTDLVLKFAEQKRKKADFADFLKNSASLFKENIFFQTNSVAWRASNANYIFEYDSLPKILFPKLDLVCLAKGDSSVVYNTSGIYFPTLEKWEGAGGKVTWERAEFDPEKTYCEFQDYTIRIKGSSYVIDSVLFHNEFFSEPLMGQLTEKVLADKTGDKASYPRFESYNKRLQIKNIFKNVDYEGGFTMAGNKLAGSGTTEEPARIIIHRNGEKFLTSESLGYAIRPDRVSSLHTSVLIKIENDSISHPDLNFQYNNETRELVLLRQEEGRSKSPYFNSFHGIDMYYEAMYWNIDDPLIEMGSLRGSTQHYGAFESADYFKKMRYDAMIGIGFSHPLVEIRDYCRENGVETFYAYELAGFLRTSAEQIHPVLIDLSNKGFIDYDVPTQYCVVKQKLYDTLMRSAGRKDYDVLQFNSEVGSGNNAQLNLLNYNLLLRGVKTIHLSDSQQVTIYPAKEEVIVKKNRDFKFGGRVWAGNFEFMGSEYAFNYDEFKLDLLKVDSCRIYVEDIEAVPDRYGKRPRLRVKNVLEDVSGTLKIDAPTNKSGVHSDVYTDYPIFDCNKDTYVYYDHRNIQGGVYDRDRFYYQVEPFRIDSLDNFAREDLEFNGTLVSAGIFPDINEPLVLMDDLSLGFDKTTSESGLPLYGGKGGFTSDITLDYNGLQGSGELEYLTSQAISDLFVFFPDSTKGRTTAYVNREQPGSIEIPKATADVVDIGFYPTKDLLTATTVDENIEFFEEEATLTGTLALKPAGMTGKGTMFFEGAELDSDLFKYKRRQILADTSDFRLTQADLENLAFKTDNVNSKIDFNERLGEFKSNGGETKIEFPTNQYICFMDEFKWFMDENEMELTSSRKATDDFVIDTSEEASRSNFFSVNEFQDSLNFLAPKALYDIGESIITCNKIKYIAVADSKITPDSGKVVINKRARMQTLENATVLSNYVTKYHQIYNARLDINGRLDYEGEGDYTYVDEDKKEQIIHIGELEVDTTLQTVGKGLIDEEDEFFLSPFFEFAGDFELYANAKNLTFDGGTRILHTCEELERNWFKFRSEIDPVEIFIPVDTTLRDVRASKLGVGVMVADDSPIELYSAFLSRKKDREDAGLIEALGFLYYDKKASKYHVGSKEKIKQPDLPGNLVSLNTGNCIITGDGKIDLQIDLGLMKFEPIGSIRNDGMKNETSIASTAALDFYFDPGGMKRLTEQIELWPGLSPVDVTKTPYEKSIREIMGLEESDKVISELNLNGQFKKIPEALINGFYFADIKFEWDDVEEAYRSVGALGIASMGKKQLFRYVKGKMEIVKRRSGDIFRLYLELDPENWYFFEYKLGIMNVISTDKEFVGLLQEVKDDKRSIKEGKQKFSYQVLASRKKRNDFVDQFREFD
jgi:hypothetical protein